MKKALLTITVGMMIFAGCATQKEIMLQEGHSLAYADGFEDGCHSGKQAGGNMFESFKKDENRFTRQNKYAQGWSDGFRQCEREEESLERQSRIAIEQQRLYDEQKHYDKVENYHLLDHTNFGPNFEKNLRASQR